MKTIEATSLALAKSLQEQMPMITTLPDLDTNLLAGFIADSLRHQFGTEVGNLVGATPEGVLRDCPPSCPSVGSGALNEQVGGNHYKGMRIQHAEFCQANELGWCESAAMKYLCRHGAKGKVEDLKKAIHYIRLCARLVYNLEI